MTDVDKSMTLTLGRWATRALTLVLLAALAGGVPALHWAGLEAGLGHWLSWTMPVVVDGSIVVLSLAAVARRAQQQSARWMWTTVAFMVAISAALQALHARSSGGGWVGASVAALIPVVVLISSHAWLDVSVGQPVKRPARRATPVASTAPAPRAESNVVNVTQPKSRPPQSETHTASQSKPAGGDRADLKAQALTLLEGGASHREVAAALNVGKTTVTRWANAA